MDVLKFSTHSDFALTTVSVLQIGFRNRYNIVKCISHNSEVLYKLYKRSLKYTCRINVLFLFNALVFNDCFVRVLLS